jgi:RHS repeat-associated protein
MTMPGRSFIAGKTYRYGFNGKENDGEVQGQQDYGFRIYDTRIARFKSVDPLTKKYPWFTPYQFASNSPIYMLDLDGAEGVSWLWIDGIKGSKPKLKEGEWYNIKMISSTGGLAANGQPFTTYDLESFGEALICNAANNKPEVYKTIGERHTFYQEAQKALESYSRDSK